MYRIKNWNHFQHYGDRRSPPWIKLHFELLTSEMWVMLDDTSRVLAITCMLLASRNRGEIKGTPEYIQKIASLNKKPNFKPLLDIGFLEPIGDASIMLASASTKESASPNKEKESEKEEDKNKIKRVGEMIKLPSSVPVKEFGDYLNHRKEIKKPLTPRAIQLALVQLDKMAHEGQDIKEVINQTIRNGWQGLFEVKGRKNGRHEKIGYGNILDAGIAANFGEGTPPPAGDETGYGQGDIRLLENSSDHQAHR